MIYRGTTTSLAATFYDQPGGDPQDPSSLSLDILSGGAAVAGPWTYPGEILRDALGLFRFLWAIPADLPVGTYTARWTAQMPNDPPGSPSIGYEMLEISASGPLTLAEFKESLNMSPASSGNDAELARTLASATEAAEGIVGPIAPVEIVERHSEAGATLCLRKLPVLSVSSITARNGGATIYEAGDLDLDPATGILRLAWGGSFGLPDWGGATVTYTAGREVVPQSIRDAIAIIGDHLWEQQRGWASRPNWKGEQPESEDGSGVPMGFMLPNRAIQLLEPYRQVVLA